MSWTDPGTIASALGVLGISSGTGTVVGKWLQRRSDKADVAGKIEEISGRLVERQQRIVDRQDAEINRLDAEVQRSREATAEQAGLLKGMRDQINAQTTYILADSAWHAQVSALLAQAGMTAPPAPNPPPFAT